MQNMSSQIDQALNAVVLPGGGARGAYQVGVLKAISEFMPARVNPFPVICGTSAGAINAAVLASHAHEFQIGTERLVQFWGSMVCDRIYRTDAWNVFRSALRWAVSLSTGGWLAANPRSLLDNSPLQGFLEQTLKLEGIDTAIRAGALSGVSITASGYTCASAISFYQGRADIPAWERSRRQGVPSKLTLAHLMASAALPLLFPAELIGKEYFGDGGMRMIAPLSPAIHLGAEKILIIATRDEHPDPPPQEEVPYPSLGEIGGHLLDTVFMDTLNADLARMRRTNHLLEMIPEQRQSELGLKTIDSLVVRPSRDLREITHRHVESIPWAVRVLLRALGGWGRDWRMASYLLFDRAYCNELIRLGHSDAMNRRDELTAFLSPDGRAG
jgi:NTE family protein